jgi:hypothetical protein
MIRTFLTHTHTQAKNKVGQDTHTHRPEIGQGNTHTHTHTQAKNRVGQDTHTHRGWK